MDTNDKPKRKGGRPRTGRQTIAEVKASLIEKGGRIYTYRVKPTAAAQLAALEASGEFATTTAALDAAIAEAAERRGLSIAAPGKSDDVGDWLK